LFGPFTFAKLAHRDFRQDAQPFVSVIVEKPAGLRSIAPLRGRLHGQNANRVDLVVRIKAGVGALHGPVPFLPVPVRYFSSARPGGGYLSRTDDTVRKAFPFVKARRADQTEGRALRELTTKLAVVGQWLQVARLLHSVDALVRDQRPRP